jgi:hypothetical protein
MTGNRMWLYIGLILAIVGIILIVLGLSRPGRGRTTKESPSWSAGQVDGIFLDHGAHGPHGCSSGMLR